MTGSTTIANFSVTYALADGTVNGLGTGAAISFPAVDINATTTATIEIANQGTGAGSVSAIAVSGNGFRLTGAPALPATVAAGQSVRFGILFAPTQAGSYNGTFRIDLPGRSISGSLTASTASPRYCWRMSNRIRITSFRCVTAWLVLSHYHDRGFDDPGTGIEQ